MGEDTRIWFINNDASGSNNADAVQECMDACADHAMTIAHRTSFPSEDLPTPELLDAANIDIVAIYAGDGTINAALDALAGWGGAALVLPGGTMNLLYHRLFDDASFSDVIAAVGHDRVERFRPCMIESACGNAYAGLLAGPGTAWNDVREAMRNNAPLEMAGQTRAAFAETLYGDRLRCARPDVGRKEGYPLILLSPENDTIVADGYHAENGSEYFEQLVALAAREFREGPHERLGDAERFVLENVEGGTFGVLVDGEPCEASGATEFSLVPTKVDLLATRTDG